MPAKKYTDEFVLGDDVFQPFSVQDGADVSDWSEWVIEAYLRNINNGTIVTNGTLTVADGTVVKTAEGEFYIWIKSAVTNALAAGRYILQVRRIDTDDRYALAIGTYTALKYALAA